jgi:hypothetical protein
MWLDRAAYDETRKALWEAVAKNTILERQVEAQQATLTWMAVRVTQVEHERAQLLFNYTGVKVETPHIAPVPNPIMEDITGQATSFEDVGDEIAARMGITHNADGTLNYGKR